ncbi:MAG: protease SohB [Algicola sp.]|nr:protease SohB [Algicola sp.]
MEFLYNYGLFLAQAITIVAAIVAVIVAVAATAIKPKSDRGEIEIEDISAHLQDVKHQFEAQVLSKETLKQRQKDQKKALKAENKGEQPEKPHLFVIDFNGSTDANEVESLREEITAVLTIATDKDEVLLKVESPGGVVHGYGLAASQMMRLKDANIPLTVSVDVVAASGGYMMACVADKIIAAPFAIIGSIGVMAQIPNFNKILKKYDVDYELFTAGEYKRTVTMFGENDEKGRAKFKQELEEVHTLFKDFVVGNRASLDIDSVATGEHWYGSDALKKGLVDHLQTSDDYLMSKSDSHKVIGVKCSIKLGIVEKLGLSLSIGADRLLLKWWQRSQTPIK